MSSKFTIYDKETMFLLPPSIDDWLPKDHIARFVVDTLSKIDMSEFEKQYSPLGRKAYPVEMLWGLLFYGYITGVYSSRKIENATYDSVAFRFIAANTHPEHDTIATFRKKFSQQLDGVFLQILLIATESGVLKMGNISTDGSKIKANASKHKALSYEYANKLEEQLKEEVAQLKKMAEEPEVNIPVGMSIPEELTRRNDRLEVIEAAKKEIETRAKNRFEKEDAEYKKKIAQRKEHEEKTGNKKGGKPPEPPSSTPEKTDQVNLTDEESRIMPKSGGGFEQAYNAQATVDVGTMLIVAHHVSQHPNDKLEILPALRELKKTENFLQKNSKNLASTNATKEGFKNLLGDTGFHSASNVCLCKEAGIVPLIAAKRDHHNKSITERFETISEIPQIVDAVAQMKYQLQTKEGKELYAKRKTTIEPTFGIIKNVMGFRSFSLRGFSAVQGEWTLVSIAWNLKRLFSLMAKLGTQVAM